MSETTQTVPEIVPEPEQPPRSPWRWVKWAAIGVAVAVALVYGAIFFYANVLNDAPDEFDSGDLSAALVEEPEAAAAEPAIDEPVADEPAVEPAIDEPAVEPVEPVEPVEGADAEPAPVVSEAPAEEPTAAAPAAGFDGVWVPTEASEFGYRVEEVLAGVNTTAVGRGNDIAGALTIEGTQVIALDVEVDVANITSDDSRRDGQFRGRIMETEQFPTATFRLTSPIELGQLPAEGEQITATATGDLTLHGVTRAVTFDVTAEATAGRIGVLGNIPVLFSDYEIDNPSFSAVKTEDNGLLEFVLVFEPR